MALPTTGPISLYDLDEQFGGEKPDGLKEYYKGGEYVAESVTADIPHSGEIGLFDFRGAGGVSGTTGFREWTTPGEIVITVPSYASFLEIEVWGAGGSSGESTYSGTGGYDSQGFDGVAGQLSAVIAQGGSLTMAQQTTKPSSVGPFPYQPSPTVNGAWATAQGGGGGGGWKGTASKGVPQTPDGTDGADGTASVKAQRSGDAVTTGGNTGSGGPKLGFYGNEWNRGGNGGDGGYAKKRILRSDADSPDPKDKLKGFVGRGGEILRHNGGATIGKNGKVKISWG